MTPSRIPQRARANEGFQRLRAKERDVPPAPAVRHELSATHEGAHAARREPEPASRLVEIDELIHEWPPRRRRSAGGGTNGGRAQVLGLPLAGRSSERASGVRCGVQDSVETRSEHDTLGSVAAEASSAADPADREASSAAAPSDREASSAAAPADREASASVPLPLPLGVPTTSRLIVHTRRHESKNHPRFATTSATYRTFIHSQSHEFRHNNDRRTISLVCTASLIPGEVQDRARRRALIWNVDVRPPSHARGRDRVPRCRARVRSVRPSSARQERLRTIDALTDGFSLCD
jgi:hypothetical protein